MVSADELRARAWCFTINNYTKTDWFGVRNAFKKAEYAICGEEIAPTTGTPHLQGYVRYKSDRSGLVMSKAMPRASFRLASGNDLQNQVYCGKGANIYVIGEPSAGQGSRTDIKEIAQKIKNHEITLEDLMFEYPEMYVKYSRSFEKMFNAVARKRTVPSEIYWRWGKAGVGKTRYCEEKHPSNFKKDGTPWWDNYTQQEAIIIDDFDNNIPFRTLLRIIDRYDYQGQVKGGYVQINSPYIYITCEFPPEYYWSGNELAQVKRRLTSVEEIK